MTPDQYRREGAEAMRAACAHAVNATASPIVGTPYSAGGRAFADAIRAIDVDEVLAKLGPAPDAMAQLVLNADRLLPEFLATAARNIDFDGPWDDFDLSGGLRAVIAAMETSNGE